MCWPQLGQANLKSAINMLARARCRPLFHPEKLARVQSIYTTKTWLSQDRSGTCIRGRMVFFVCARIQPPISGTDGFRLHIILLSTCIASFDSLFLRAQDTPL